MSRKFRVIVGIGLVTVAFNIIAVCYSHPEGGLLYNVLATNALLFGVLGLILALSTLEG